MKIKTFSLHAEAHILPRQTSKDVVSPSNTFRLACLLRAGETTASHDTCEDRYCKTHQSMNWMIQINYTLARYKQQFLQIEPVLELH